jgi:hypothetical protein
MERLQWMASHVEALRIEDTGLRQIVLVLSPQERAAFRSVATDWELSNSRILNVLFPTDRAGVVIGVPIVDDLNTVLAYFDLRREIAFVRDIDGTVIAQQTWEIPLEPDPIGQAIIDIIGTLGVGLITSMLRSMTVAVLSRAGSALAEAAIVVARGISAEAETGLLLVLRAQRAQFIVRAFKAQGLEAIANVGGEGGAEEIAKFGKQIALNPSPRESAGFVPFLIEENGENIGKVFKPESLDAVVSHELDVLTKDGGLTFTFGMNDFARGAFKTLRPGGRLTMGFHLGLGTEAKFGEQFVKALVDAGFNPKNIQNFGNRAFRAIK